MNLNNSQRKLIFLFSVMATMMLITLFSNFFVLLSNPRSNGSLDLLIMPALADDYGLDTTANKAYGPTYMASAKILGVSGLTGQIIGAILSIIGVIFLGLMVYGGVLWMTARGKEDQITKAKEIITSAFIGLVIVIAAYAITRFVMQSVAPPSSSDQKQEQETENIII